MIHLIVGATGAGKTTYAMRLARERSAILFISDDWLNTLFVPDVPPKDVWEWALVRIERCEGQIWKIAQQILNRGVEVVLDINMMNRATRDKQRALAKASGSPFQLHYLDVDRERRWDRVSKRNREKGDTYKFEVSREFFDFVENVLESPTETELRGALIRRNEDLETSADEK